MGIKLLQINFPYAGPWGADMTKACLGLAQVIADAEGLLWKVWIENETKGEAGGVYLFENERAGEAFLRTHRERLQAIGIENISAKTFDVNKELTEITRGKLGRT